MKSRKTNQNKRDYYVYKHADGSSVTLNPGENGVTEMDIYNLHRLDDREVDNYYRTIRPDRTDE